MRFLVTHAIILFALLIQLLICFDHFKSEEVKTPRSFSASIHSSGSGTLGRKTLGRKTLGRRPTKQGSGTLGRKTLGRETLGRRPNPNHHPNPNPNPYPNPNPNPNPNPKTLESHALESYALESGPHKTRLYGVKNLGREKNRTLGREIFFFF